MKNKKNNNLIKDKDKEKIFKTLKEDEKLLNIDISVDNFSDEGNIDNNEKLDMVKNKKYPWQLIISIIFIVLIGFGIIISITCAPKLTLNSSKKINLNYKEKYKEPGYKLIVNNKDYSDKVKIKGRVNSNKLGTYEIEYYYKNGIFRTSKKRIVVVKDKTKPVIMLSGSKNTYICPNSSYKEDGYEAIDNYDGNITKNVQIVKNDTEYIYSVKDSSGNKTIIKRNIFKKDIVKPVITFNDDKIINIEVGSSYNDKNYVAFDNCDLDITDKVVIEGSYDINKVGSYVLKYKVKDDALNETIEEKTINVLEKEKKGVVYLTFDDGPKLGVTDEILNILKEEGVKATFFVTNSGPDYLIKREYDEGHTVALHTSSHNYSVVYSSVNAFYNDLESVQNRVYNITGYKSMIIRFPGGSSNTISRRYKEGIMSTLTADVLQKGYRYYDWNISSGDAGETTLSSQVYKNVISNLSYDRVNMVLMHDIKEYTKNALRDIIRYCKQNGYTFETINNNTPMVTQRVNN